jgi:hypothetical protein
VCISIGEPEEKRKFERPRRRGENNIKPGLREIVCDDLVLIHLAKDTN